MSLVSSIMRRKVGVAAVNHKKNEATKFNQISREFEETKLSFVRETLETFKISLTTFAAKHRNRINSDPEFRMQFHSMCLNVGVDPLASSKGFWADLLGVGDFHFELAVQIVQICMRSRNINGGIMPLNELLRILRSSHAQHKETNEDDVRRATRKLSILGNGFRILEVGGLSMVVSVPLELNKDHEELLEISQDNIDSFGHAIVSFECMRASRGWTQERFIVVINTMMTEGLVWLDYHEGTLTQHRRNYC